MQRTLGGESRWAPWVWSGDASQRMQSRMKKARYATIDRFLDERKTERQRERDRERDREREREKVKNKNKKEKKRKEKKESVLFLLFSFSLF